MRGSLRQGPQRIYYLLFYAHAGRTSRGRPARLVATENRRHFTPLLRHGIRVLVSAELADEIRS